MGLRGFEWVTGDGKDQREECGIETKWLGKPDSEGGMGEAIGAKMSGICILQVDSDCDFTG
jgi:hypothetical protein